MNQKTEYDIVVVGGGPAGYVAAIKAAQLGADTALIEADILGGNCLNWGCIPTKAYLKNAEIIEEIRGASRRGIKLRNDEFTVDMPETVKMKDRIVKKLTGGVAALLKANKVDVLKGRGILTSENTVQIDSGTSVQGKKIIIAGGSRVARIPIPGIENPAVMTSNEILSMYELPSSLAVIGGGVIGVEMALIFLSFGVKVEIIEMEDRILPFMDASISDFISGLLKKRGGEIFTAVRLDSVTENGKGISLALSSGTVLQAERALLSIGRVPDLSALGEIGIVTRKNCIVVNEYQETSIPGIYAAGDITGQKMLAHAAFKMGEIAAENALGAGKSVDLSHVPSVVYSLPEVASVGLTEAEAVEKTEISTGYFPLSANGKALAVGESDGFVKVITDKKYGEVLGVHIAGPGASEIINEAAALMAMEVTSHEIADIIHGHPTVGEAFMEAAADSLGRCLHLPPV